MNFATFFTSIPFLLSLPTVLLSSILTAQIPSAQHDQHELLIHYLIPMLQSLVCFFIFHSIMKNKLKDDLQRWKLLFLSLTTFIINSYMGPVQTSILMMILVFHAANMIVDINTFYFLPNLALSFGAEYFQNQKYADVIISYVLYGLLWVFSQKTASLEPKLKKLSLLKVTASLFLLVSIITLGYIFHRSPVFILQQSMGVVFIGSLIMCTISFQYLYQEFLKTISSNDPNGDLKIKPHYVIGVIGVIAIALQFLSFEVIKYSAATFSLFVLYNIWFMKQYLFEKQTIKLKEGETIGKFKLTENDSENKYDDNQSMFLQLALTKETRSIFSFLLLNTSFMLVQLLYSFRSKSLGLLSDSLHMALDCTSLFLGLCAGVLAKKPPNAKYPLGLKYLETLAGFTNGVLLVGIVCGIFVEALERIFTKSVDIRDTTELLIVSILGLLVNLVGLVAFDHGHGSEEHSDNMRGIFLHILADTLGSVGVVISTILTKIFHNSIFDPIASIMIAFLILISSIPLLESSSRPLLLKLDDKHHNLVKEALNRVQLMPGIVGYTTPRFWQNNVDVHHAHSHSHAGSNTHTPESHVNEHNEHNHNHSLNNHSHKEESDHHLHSHTLTSSCSENHNVAKLCGYIHIQYREGENSVIIKKRCEKVFENNQIDAYIQVESDASKCWCRR